MSTAGVPSAPRGRGTLEGVHVWYGLEQVPALQGSVVTIGNFDGVHRGHAAVLADVVATAKAQQLPAVAVTFDPHPAMIHRPDEAPQLLTGLAEKLELLAECDLDAVLVLEYTKEFAATSPREFVRRYLVDALAVSAVVVGQDVRFGAGNSGDGRTMAELAHEYGFTLHLLPDVAREGGRRWSSSWARELLAQGDVAAAAEVLGHDHRMHGEVVHGQARGRELGFPTANLSRHATGMIPADGVYAGWLTTDPSHGSRRMPAAISVGTNPTFEGLSRGVEAYVLHRSDLELYGQNVLIEFSHRLRETMKFTGVDDLIEQMHRDVALADKLLAAGADCEQ